MQNQRLTGACEPAKCHDANQQSIQDLTEPVEQVWQTWRPLDQCFDWDGAANPVRNMHIVCTDLCPHKLHSPNCGDLKQADFERGGHTFLPGVAWNTIQTKLEPKHWPDFGCCFFMQLHKCGWNRHCRPISMRMDVKWTKILLLCQH